MHTSSPSPSIPASALHERRSAGVLVLTALLAANAVVAFAGSLAVRTSVDGWYAQADKAPWSPPNWLFAPAWTVLYVLMAVAAWLVWRQGGWRAASGALWLYVAQLALNAAWTPVFFGAQLLWPGLVVIVALDVVVVATMVAFGRHSRAAAWLLAPYLAWIVFATSLNAAVALLN
ncbi:MAG: TspO/MBR family protein [Cellulomonadaceae bacterium]